VAADHRIAGFAPLSPGNDGTVKLPATIICEMISPLA
jgi:hypothetical protein